MQVLETEEPILQDILDAESVVAHFQPILSIKNQSMTGVEALARAFNPKNNRPVSPFDLFRMAEKEDKMVETDRLCRKKALEAFQGFRLNKPDLLLFLNMEVSILDKGAAGSRHLRNTVEKLGIPPTQVVIEVIESKVDDLAALNSFVKEHRELGFLIALDDVGAGHSNLDRIPRIQPDILKIDRFLVTHIQKDYYKQEVFKALVNLARKTGALVVAEGLETEEESLTCLELGADLLQGFYFCRPGRGEDLDRQTGVEKIAATALSYRIAMVNKIMIKKFQHRTYQNVLETYLAKLQGAPRADWTAFMKDYTVKHPLVECSYLLNSKGVQICPMIFSQKKAQVLQRPGIFRPSTLHADHSLKDYFYLLNESTGINRYTTEPYLSMATGKPCITLSARFQENGKDQSPENSYVLCLDIRLD